MSARSPKQSAKPRVLLVIPAFNEGKRLPPFLEALVAALDSAGAMNVCALVVDDGSAREETAAMQLAAERANGQCAGNGNAVEYLRLPLNQGKAAAIREGWDRHGQFEWCGFCDADGATSAAEIVRMLEALGRSKEIDGVLGARIKMAGREIDRSLWRHFPGRVFGTVADLALDLGCYDTQCGAKFFRSRVIEQLLPLLQETKWLLDVELLAHMKRLGMRYVEFPIDWHDAAGSKVRLTRDSLRMLIGIFRIRRRLEALSENRR